MICAVRSRSRVSVAALSDAVRVGESTGDADGDGSELWVGDSTSESDAVSVGVGGTVNDALLVAVRVSV